MRFFLIPLGLTFILLGAGCAPDTSPPPSTGQPATGETATSPVPTLTCAQKGDSVEYKLVTPEHGMPANADTPFTLAKVAGDNRCFMADQFSQASEPDRCGAAHYHGDKTATDGTTLPDLAPDKCGVATTDQVSFHTVYELTGDNPRDTPPPALYGEEIDPEEAICGPDITEKLLAAFKRVHSRMQSISSSDYGAVDGTFFLERNGNNIDFRVFRVKNDTDAAICPSEKCMAPDGQGTITLCGQCIMEHIANDMMYGFVSNQLAVPWTIQKLGAHYAEFVSYGGLDPAHSQAAYAMGNAISSAMDKDEDLSIGDFCDKLNSAKLDSANAFSILGEEHPFLKDCRRPSPECKASVSKDFSSQGWNFSK